MRRNLYKALILLSIFLFCVTSLQKLRAQDYNSFLFKQFNGINQMPSMSCMSLYKDGYGFLWIGNAYGISIYNGKEFTNLSMFSGDKNFFLGDGPQGFLQLDSNRLLISCTTGLFVFYYSSKKVEKLALTLKKEVFADIAIIGFNRAHNRLIVKADGYLYYLDLGFRLTKTLRCAIDYNVDVNVKSESTGPFNFYYTNAGYLLSLNTETALADTIAFLPNEKSIVINGASDSNFIIATSQKVYFLDRFSKKIKSSLDYPVAGKGFFPRAVKRDFQGNYWIGGEANLFICNPLNNTLREINSAVNNTQNTKINSFAISDIWIDKESLFVSSYSGGLFEYNGILRQFRDFYSRSSTDNAMFSVLVQDSTLLGAADLGGLYRFPLGKKTQAYYYPVTKDTADIIQLENIDERYIWLLFYENFKLAVLDTKTYRLSDIDILVNGVTKQYFINSLRLQSKDYRPVIKKAAADLYYLTIGKSLYNVSGSVSSGFRFTFIDSITGISSISCITNAVRRPAVGTTRGELFVLENGKLVNKTTTLNNWFLPVKAIDLDERGNTYLMTTNGIYIYDTNFKLIKHLTTGAFDLLNNKIFSGKIDSQGVLWMATSGGIISYSTHTGQIVNYSAEGFMRNKQFISKSVCSGDGNFIYFGGTEGITEVNTDLYSSSNVLNSLYFDEFTDGKRIVHQRLMPGSIDNSDEFRYNQNSFTFSFKSISYAQGNGVYFKYLLEGFDTAWNFVDADKQLHFLSLAPGSYKLRVKEMDAAGNAGKELTYSFAIKKPFWKTGIFYIISTVLVASLLTLIVIFIIRKKLTEHKAKVSLALALKDERERISQDLHDDLGSGLTSIRLLCETIAASQKAGEGSAMIADVVKISVTLIDQMSEIIWVLNHEDDTVAGLLGHIRLYIVDYLARIQRPLQFVITNDAGNYRISGIQRRNLLLVIKEIFHNVIKHSPATHFSILFSLQGKGICIEIQDNGTGLPQTLGKTGNGLNNISKRIVAIGGQLSMTNANGLKTVIELPGPSLPLKA